MRRSVLLLFLLLLSGLISEGPRAQSLIIKFNNGNEDTDPLGSIRTLTFAPGQLMVNFNAGITDSYNLADLRKLYFNTPLIIGEQTVARFLRAYPNPGQRVVTVTGIPAEAGSVTFYGMDGRPVLTGEASCGKATVDVSKLQPGIYLVRAMGQTAKFVRP